MTTPHQSGAPFVGERAFKIEGFAGKRSLLSPPPPPSFNLFALAPFFALPECDKLIRAARISFASYGNACYAGYQGDRAARVAWERVQAMSGFDLSQPSEAFLLFGKFHLL